MKFARTQHKTRERGFTLIAVAVSLLVLIGIVGIVVDVGHIFIVKNEVQQYTDSASLAATLELDGTWAGINRASDQVALNPNKWNFVTSQVTDPQVSFAQNEAGPWVPMPSSPAGYRLARVTATVNVPLLFMPVFLAGQSASGGVGASGFLLLQTFQKVNGDSASGQEPKNSWNQGLFPFSPYAHDPVNGPYFGLVPGRLYTLRWASNPKINNNVCPGDNDDPTIALATANGGSERGFIESTSSSLLRATIVQDYQTVTRTIGDSVTMTGGAKQTQLTSLLERINQDGDSSSTTYAQYVATGRATGRRLVGAPINSGYPDYRIVQIGAFLLLPASQYSSGGNAPFCAEFVGAWVQGSRNQGAGTPGAYVARIIQ
jgi:Flp pilus assembly protein TadG